MVQQLVDGIAHEVAFWRAFVKTERFLNGWASGRPNPELHEYARSVLGALSGQVLDVGSGPVSILQGSMPAASIIASDMLARFYEGLVSYEKLGLLPPHPVRAEGLVQYFGSAKFDVVHCSNALDHCQDPFSAVSQMKEVLAPGGLLFIQGFENEADNEKWAGMHQWNIRAMPGKGIVIAGWDGKETLIRGEVKVTELESEKTWYYYEYRH